MHQYATPLVLNWRCTLRTIIMPMHRNNPDMESEQTVTAVTEEAVTTITAVTAAVTEEAVTAAVTSAAAVIVLILLVIIF